MLGALGKLRLDRVEDRWGQWAAVFKQDHVVTEVGLDRGFGIFAFFELGERITEWLDVAGGAAPAEVAAVFLGAGVLGLLGQLFKFDALFEVGDDRLGVVFFFDQDVAGLVFSTAKLRLDRLVVALQLRIGDRVRLHEVLDIGANVDGLACQLSLCGDCRPFVEAFLFGFLGQQLAANEFFTHGVLQLRRVLCALGFLLGNEGISGALLDGDAIDRGKCFALGGFGGKGRRRDQRAEK